MSGYLVSFTVYTMAMCGLIFFALFVYKKFTEGSLYTKSSKFLNVEDTLSLAPRKTLYVVRAGGERFLVAGDMDKTTLISKLDMEKDLSQSFVANGETKNTSTELNGIDELPVIVDFSKPAKGSLSNSPQRMSVKKPSGNSMIMEIVKRIKE